MENQKQELTENQNCKCEHNRMRHNRFMDKNKPFGCVDCECIKFKETQIGNWKHNAYMIISRRQLLSIWKKANKECMKQHGKKKLSFTVCLKLSIIKNHKVDGREQIQVLEHY